ncbi:hypothetical protein DFJ58DRAFT_741927 [Suillus subalutaceus]|uniref:uncharacterized protein n=1 Tax=Suillus subalutaceus TaxID=48586 RepID=UPI001B86393D|nr:uncharacterized protein DFJ58DRAFT_741927 [Suillus subalutaceus]KAG1871752.1 hypothetical protein DFJ58DRAFT_741927 [Suillus subalutaceus]
MRVLKAGLLQTSFSSYSLVMDPIANFPFTNLPAELALLILKYAAQPTFDQTDKYETKSPYSSTLALCHVSKAVRRVALPELLHTVSLPKSENLRMFVDALRMQQEYAEIQKQNESRLECGEEQTQNDLYFDYAPHIHKIWIGCSGANIVPDHLLHPHYAPARKLAISVLTPVLLATPSLALAWTSLGLFSECLEHAWKYHADTNANDEQSPRPWNTKTLTLSGETTAGGQWELLKDTPQGSAFLASISHLTYGSHTTTFDEFLFISMSHGLPRSYNLPSWMKSIPWPHLKNLQTFSMAYPYIRPPFDIYDFEHFIKRKGRSFHVEVLTLSAAMLTRRRDDRRDWRISAFGDTAPGKEYIRSDRVGLKVSDSSIQFWFDDDDWEKIWACGLCA